MCLQKEPTVLEQTVRSLDTHLLLKTRILALPLGIANPDTFCYMKVQSVVQQWRQAGPLHLDNTEIGPSSSQTLKYPRLGNKRQSALLGVTGWLHISFVGNWSLLLSFKNWLIWGKGVKFAFERLSLQYASFPLNPSMRSIFSRMLVLSLFSFPKMSVTYARRHIFCWSHRKSTKSVFFTSMENANISFLSLINCSHTLPFDNHHASVWNSTFSYSESMSTHSFANRWACRGCDLM